MDYVSVTKLYRQTERHDEADSGVSQFCDKCLKIITVTCTCTCKCTRNLKFSRGEYVEYGIPECDAV